MPPLISNQQPPGVTRRDFFGSMSGGLGAAALAGLLSQDLYGTNGLLAAESVFPDQTPKQPHFEPQAKAVIHLFMNGGPSQMDLFDPKEELTRNHGKSYFDKIAGEVENPGAAGALMRSPFRFRKYGECGMDVSELLPHLSTQVDRISLVRSMYTSNLTHEPALFIAHCGRMTPGLPSLGSWVTYGLGSENQNLPAYIVLDDPAGLPVNGVQNWQAGFLPPVYQGTRFRSTGKPVLNLDREYEESDSVVKLERDLIGTLDRIHRRRRTLARRQRAAARPACRRRPGRRAACAPRLSGAPAAARPGRTWACPHPGTRRSGPARSLRPARLRIPARANVSRARKRRQGQTTHAAQPRRTSSWPGRRTSAPDRAR